MFCEQGIYASRFKNLHRLISNRIFLPDSAAVPKALMPGLCTLRPLMKNPGAANNDSPRAAWGITEGNPRVGTHARRLRGG
jgi:hypothetical protein